MINSKNNNWKFDNFLREREKLNQREELWAQVESLAKNNPEWPKMIGLMESLSISSSQTDFDQIPDNCDLSYDKLEQESREVGDIFVCKLLTISIVLL